MPDHDTKFSLNQHAKRRRVDIGVKRTVTSAATLTQTPSGIITAKPTVMNGIRKQDVLESQAGRLGHMDMGATRSNDVLRKLLKRTSSYGDEMVPFHSAAIISSLLKRNMSKGGGDQGITESKASQEDSCCTSSQDSPQECPSPSANATLYPFDSERLNDEHLRAKRARVENIIRGMSHSPNMTAPSIPRGNDRGRYEDGETEGPLQSGSPRDNYRENKRKQKLPQQQHRSYQQLVSAHKEQKVEERRQLKLQLEDMQKQLRQLQEKLFQMYDSTDSEADGGNISEDSIRSDEGLIDADLNEDSRSNNDLDPGQFLDQARALLGEQVLSVGEKSKRKSSLQGKDLISIHEEGKHLAETLKQELNSAMSQVVETVVKIFARSRRTTQDYNAGNGDSPDFHTSHQRVQCLTDVINPSPLESFGGAPLPSANHQTEAMSLVVRKSPFEHHQSSALGANGGHPHPSLHPSSLSANMTFSSPSFPHPFPLSLMAYSFQSAFGAPSSGYSRKDQNFPDSMDLSRESIGMPTKMSSDHHLGHHRSCSPVHPGSTAEGPSLSFIKSECGDLQDMSDISTYSGSTVQEGLSPNHLKKAKVMFFYSRYPSSNTLKMYFPDVKFNRCITSQLIKWFSNFREFFYIQMEKFARQAINDGVLTADDLSVTCDSELYRVLNMHYNKSNDFQVPERFLEVAQITLREFFNAIVSGKDVDPSWKKAIYKVICKLDSEVPEIFKSKNCLLKLLHE